WNCNEGTSIYAKDALAVTHKWCDRSVQKLYDTVNTARRENMFMTIRTCGDLKEQGLIYIDSEINIRINGILTICLIRQLRRQVALCLPTLGFWSRISIMAPRQQKSEQCKS